MKKSIAVIGAGAIGGITAAFLAKAGHDVQIVCKYEDKAKLAREQGLHVTGMRGEHYIKMNAVAEIEQLSGKKGLYTHRHKSIRHAGRSNPLARIRT